MKAGGYGVEAMFDEIEAALRRDAAAGARNYLTAVFDAADGHPLRYVRRVRGSGERVEWVVTLRRLGAGGLGAAGPNP